MDPSLTLRKVPLEGQLGLKKWPANGSWTPFGIPMHIFNAFFILIPAHVLGVYSMYLDWAGHCSDYFWWNLLFTIVYGYLGGIGVTAGAHRLWTHKSYKANKKLEFMLMLFQTSSLQYPAIKWCRDHRIHHKYTDTNADPHSAARGFWFSHMGWVVTPEHPEVLKKEKTIPMGDLEDNPILEFQARHYWLLVLLTVFVIPSTFMYIFFPQPLFNIICLNCARWIFMINISACVNSVAHIWGDHPYDKELSAVDNKILSIFTIGEAWHNYHHTFPWDYKTSELPFYTFNVSTAFIDFFAWLGWATELKTVPKEMIDGRANRTGDGTRVGHKQEPQPHPQQIREEEEPLEEPLVKEIEKARIQGNGKIAAWGWGDEDMDEERKIAEELMTPFRIRG